MTAWFHGKDVGTAPFQLLPFFSGPRDAEASGHRRGKVHALLWCSLQTGGGQKWLNLLSRLHTHQVMLQIANWEGPTPNLPVFHVTVCQVRCQKVFGGRMNNQNNVHITYGPHEAVAEVSNHNKPIGRKSGIQLVRKIRKSMDFTFSCFVLN